MSLQFTSAPGGELLEIATEAPVVTAAFLNQLIDDIANYLDERPRQYAKILLIVTAPRADLTITESYQAWHQASRRGIWRTQFAYVMDGRPLSPLAQFIEVVAQNRQIYLRFFEHREPALEWLTVSAAEGGLVT